MAKKKAKDAVGEFKKRMNDLMGEGNWQVTINGGGAKADQDGKKAEVVFGDDAPVWGTELHTISVPINSNKEDAKPESPEFDRTIDAEWIGEGTPVKGTARHTISLLVIPEWCACENRDAERDGYCADCGGKIRQS